MTVSAELPSGINRGVHRLELAVVEKGRTVFRPSTIVTIASAPLYTVVYKGIKCLEETDEVGSDEPYALIKAGNLNGHMNGTETFLYKDMDEGEYRATSRPVMKSSRIPKVRELLVVVGLMEHDDGFWQKILNYPDHHSGKAPSLGTPIKPDSRAKAVARYKRDLRNLLKAEAWNQRNPPYGGEAVEDIDDLVDVEEVPLSEKFLWVCRTTQGWRKKSVVLAGDGGRYRLDFAIRAGSTK